MGNGWQSAPWRAAFLVMLGGWILITLVDFLIDLPEVAVRVSFLLMIVLGFAVGENHDRIVRPSDGEVGEGGATD